jgi:hypothetical protein
VKPGNAPALPQLLDPPAVDSPRDFGRDIVLWSGGCDTLKQVYNILVNVPPPNIVAMFDAVRA